MKTELKSKLVAFHGSQEIKNKYLSRLKAHYIADEIIQGIGWENGKGCAVGCTLKGLPNSEAKKFPAQFLSSIEPGVDLSKVAIKFKIWLLIDKDFGAINNIKKNEIYSEECIKAVNQVADFLQKKLDGFYKNKSKSESAFVSNWKYDNSIISSVEEMMDDDPDSWEAWSVGEVVESNVDSTARAAWSAAESNAESMTGTGAYIKMRDKLLELLSGKNKGETIL